MKNAIIIGASSGIGRELALQLTAMNYRLCVTARREDLLKKLGAALSRESFTRKMDISDTESAISIFSEITRKLGTVDLIIISAGTGFINPEMPWENDKCTIDVNVRGFTAIANTSYQFFKEQGYGQLAGISSVAAVRGGATAAYNASKAYVSSYLAGLRAKAAKEKLSLTVSDIRPGLVDTAMAQGEGLFWVAPVPKAAKQIIQCIERKKRIAYITKRWRLIAILLKLLPEGIYNRIA